MTVKREDTRVVIPIAMILEVGSESKGCFTRNISRGGLFVVTNLRAPEGATVKVSLTHMKRKLSAAAQVVNVAKEGMGLRFTEKSPAFTAGINALINGLLDAKGGGVAARAVSKTVQAGAAWAYPLGEQDTETWQKTVCPVSLHGLSHDGAAMESAKRPEIGEEILFFITTPQEPGRAHHCKAETVRHIDRGFAVKFITPSIQFRRTISELRRSAAEAD